ncbi:MAG: AAA family ATPase [Oligoflexales bacterium]
MKKRYYEYWGAQSPVFVNERAPGSLFWSSELRNLFDEILQWTSVSGRVISVVGESGSGKTSFVREIYHCYPHEWDVSVSIVTGWETDPLWLMGSLARFFGGDEESWRDPDIQLQIVQQGIEQLHEEGRHLLLLLDGVERLQRSDDLNVLRDIQELCGHSFSVLLVGQINPYEQIDRKYELSPWTLEVVEQAILWCLKQSHLENIKIHDDMMQVLFERSAGFPGPLMRLAEGALITGSMCQAKVWAPELIPTDHIDQSIAIKKKKRVREPVAKVFEKNKKGPSGRG